MDTTEQLADRITRIPTDHSDYRAVGKLDRLGYLNSVAEDYGVPRRTVYEAALLLGAEEDFDGLLTMVDEVSALHDF